MVMYNLFFSSGFPVFREPKPLDFCLYCLYVSEKPGLTMRPVFSLLPFTPEWLGVSA